MSHRQETIIGTTVSSPNRGHIDKRQSIQLYPPLTHGAHRHETIGTTVSSPNGGLIDKIQSIQQCPPMSHGAHRQDTTDLSVPPVSSQVRIMSLVSRMVMVLVMQDSTRRPSS